LFEKTIPVAERFC